MNISIIIPTFNREKDLLNCLNSILKQRYRPVEIIIVDDSTNNSIYELTNKMKQEFISNNINLKYLKNLKQKSLAISRNNGIKESSGEIILFLDDDAILDPEYISSLDQAYTKGKNIIGMQGYIQNTLKPNYFVEILNKFFLLGTIEFDKCRVLPSARNTYPKLGTNKPINCEWLSGCNHSYRREIFNEFQYDEKMVRYSYKEDVDMSYRVFKKYPHGLYLIPQAKCIHNESQESRILQKEQIYMEFGYTTYFFYKNIDQNSHNKFLFAWSNFGFFIKKIGEILFKSKKARATQLKALIGGYINMRKHLSELKMGELSKFNSSIFTT